jgi:hypothetical protein
MELCQSLMNELVDWIDGDSIYCDMKVSRALGHQRLQGPPVVSGPFGRCVCEPIDRVAAPLRTAADPLANHLLVRIGKRIFGRHFVIGDALP